MARSAPPPRSVRALASCSPPAVPAPSAPPPPPPPGRPPSPPAARSRCELRSRRSERLPLLAAAARLHPRAAGSVTPLLQSGGPRAAIRQAAVAGVRPSPARPQTEEGRVRDDPFPLPAVKPPPRPWAGHALTRCTTPFFKRDKTLEGRIPPWRTCPGLRSKIRTRVGDWGETKS